MRVAFHESAAGVAATAAAATAAHTIQFTRPQPKPVECDVTYTRVNGGCSTAVARHWKQGDTDDCRLCPPAKCTGRGRSFCLVSVDVYVPPESTEMLSTVGLLWGASPHPERH